MSKLFLKIVGYIKIIGKYFFAVLILVASLYYVLDEMYISKEEIADQVYLRQTYPDGNYLSEVNYSNKCTGFKTVYELTVDLKGDTITRINFDNGGFLDKNNFIPEHVSKNDFTIVSNIDGCSEYKIKIIKSN